MRLIIWVWAICILGIYLVAYISHTATRIRARIDLDLLVRDIATMRFKMRNRVKPFRSAQKPRKHEPKIDHSEWQSVRYYERDGNTCKPVEK